jgi:hypothetical protein
LSDGSPPLVGQEGYGPSLPELLRPWLRTASLWVKVALVAALLALVGIILALVIRHGVEIKTYRQSSADARGRELPAIPFHFDYSRKLRLSRPQGTYVEVERRVKGTVAARLTILPLAIGHQTGLVSGFLPILAIGHERQAAERFDGFRLRVEGKARVNKVEGYQFAFKARLRRAGGKSRVLYGRVLMLPRPFAVREPDKPYPAGQAPQDGLLMELLATSYDKVSAPTALGDQGSLQRPYKTFRFGD